MDIRIAFLGAARNVTGSRFLLTVDGRRFLVDCGLHQERKFRDRDYQPFPVPPDSIEAVLLTHAHLDHCGYLPKLVHDGFGGPIYCTPASAEIARIVLLDSAYLQEEDIRYKRKRHKRSGRSSPYKYKPLYTIEHAKACAEHFRPTRLRETLDLGGGIQALFRNSGHILGSSFVRLDIGVGHGAGNTKRSIIFTGDIGRFDKPIIKDPAFCREADYLLMESTYGDRLHDSVGKIEDELAHVINDTVARGGNVVIPAFAIERSQELIYYLNELQLKKRIPRLLTFLDSPMAVRVTQVFENHPELYDEDMTALMNQGASPFRFPTLNFTRSTEQSKAINRVRGSVVIIAGSGMCTGGRIKHHLLHNIGRPESTILFIGYQAQGTLGRSILEGRKTVRILGTEQRVRARIARIQGFSAHADRDELLDWVTHLETPPRSVFVVHGEDKAAASFRRYLDEKTGWKVVLPDYRNEYRLT